MHTLFLTQKDFEVVFLIFGYKVIVINSGQMDLILTLITLNRQILFRAPKDS